MKNLLLFLVLIPSLAKAEIRLTPYAKKGDPGTKGFCAASANGEPCYMDLNEARSYCGNKKMKLPSVREYALYVQEHHHAKGIVKDPISKSGSEIRSMSRIGDIDEFYFDNSGYESDPEWHEWHSYFWTSSLAIEIEKSVYIFNGFYGNFAVMSENKETLVKCLEENRR